MRVLEAGKVLMGGLAALSINDPPPTVSLSISNFPPRPPQPKQVDPSESPGPRHTLRLRMAFVNMDAINFYEQPPPKAGPRGEKRPPASNGNVPAAGEQCETREAFGPNNRPSGRLQDCDLVEVLDMATSPPDEPLDPFGELGADVEGTGAGAGGRSPHSTIRTMVDDFADMAKELGLNRGRRRTSSDTSQDLPSLEEMLFSAKEMQEPQRAGGNGNLTGISDESLDPAVENIWKGSASPKSGRGKSKGGYISSVCR